MNELDLLFRTDRKTFLRRHFVEGRGRVFGRPLYSGLTGLELAAEQTADRLLGQDHGDRSHLYRELTAVIKVFERHEALERLLASIRRFYPELQIIVVDDSRKPQPQPGVQTITLPFNSGLAAGRNAGVSAVTTPYVLILEEDFVFYRHTNLARALAVLQGEPRIDIMGGKVINLPLYKVTDYRKIRVMPTQAKATMPEGSKLAGLPVYDIVPNFFIARSERLREVLWTESLRIEEHGDFFTRAKGVLTSVYNQELRCLHVRTLFDQPYLSHRYDLAESYDYYLTRYYGFERPSPAEESDEMPE
ncbi:MAG: glycosyltransferase family 2 protein [Candidatus Promineifilaceae bacterium]